MMGGSTSSVSRSGAALVSSEVGQQVQKTVTNQCIVIFSKTTCGYCRMAKKVFDDIGTPYEAVEINKLPNGAEIQEVLHEMTGGSTVPRVFINGKFVGGGTETRTLHKEGKLIPLIQECSTGS